MFSTVPFSFCHVKSKPLKRGGDILSLTPHAAVLPIKERSTTAANGSQSITKRREEKKSDLSHYHPHHHFCHYRPLSSSISSLRCNHHIAVAAL